MGDWLAILLKTAESDSPTFQAIAASIQAALAFALFVVGAIQTAIYLRMRKDGVSRDAAFVFMRAINTICIVETLPPDAKIGYWYFTPTWHNSGNTHAIDLIVRCNFMFAADGIPADFQYPDYIDETNPEYIPTVLGPRSEVSSGGIEISVSDLITSKAGAQRIFIYGWAEYRDLFRSQIHRTEYCSEVKVEGDPTRTDCGFSFENTGAYNRADQYCFYRHHELTLAVTATRPCRPSRLRHAVAEMPNEQSAEQEILGKRAKYRRRGKQRQPRPK